MYHFTYFPFLGVAFDYFLFGLPALVTLLKNLPKEAFLILFGIIN